jgi:hypothetical protein
MVEVSVITAAYNSAGVIERNIRSVAAQSLQPKEHIIIDDGSVDATASIVEALQREFPHLQLIRQANGGAARARNTGIAAATGRFVAFLDSDDTWTEHKLEVQIGFMVQEGVLFSYGDYLDVDTVTETVLGRHEAPEQLTYPDLLRGCPIGCLTVAFDQEALGKRFMPDVRRGQRRAPLPGLSCLLPPRRGVPVGGEVQQGRGHLSHLPPAGAIRARAIALLFVPSRARRMDQAAREIRGSVSTRCRRRILLPCDRINL